MIEIKPRAITAMSTLLVVILHAISILSGKRDTMKSLRSITKTSRRRKILSDMIANLMTILRNVISGEREANISEEVSTWEYTYAVVNDGNIVSKRRRETVKC